jgi:protein gp37
MANYEPWLGCHRVSEGCRNCYIHRADKRKGINTDFIHKSDDFYKLIEKNKKGDYKIKRGLVFMCFKSDFLIEEADEWRDEVLDMIKERYDLTFLFLTKRIERFNEVIQSPPNNLKVCVSVENQAMADYRIGILKDLPIKHKMVAIQPMLEEITIDHLIDSSFELVVLGGETGKDTRPMDYDWVIKIRDECIKHQVSFEFRQLSTHFFKNGKEYTINRGEHSKQAKKANINVKF